MAGVAVDTGLSGLLRRIGIRKEVAQAQPTIQQRPRQEELISTRDRFLNELATTYAAAQTQFEEGHLNGELNAYNRTVVGATKFASTYRAQLKDAGILEEFLGQLKGYQQLYWTFFPEPPEEEMRFHH